VIGSLRYEWVRLVTVRSTWICLALTLVLGGGLAFLIANPDQITDDHGNTLDVPVLPTSTWYQAFSAPLLIAAVLGSVVAAQAIGQEYRFGLIRLTLTAFPKRPQVLTAKVLFVLLAGVAFTATSYVGSELGVTLRRFPTPPGGDVAPDSGLWLRGVVFVVLWLLSAFAIAGVTRQTAVGIAVPIVSGLIVEQIVSAALGARAQWLTFHLPWSSAARWASHGESATVSPGDPTPVVALPPVGWSAVGVFAVWVVVFLVVEVVAFLRRDA
jgi:ABC-2 type transport system permease protein